MLGCHSHDRPDRHSHFESIQFFGLPRVRAREEETENKLLNIIIMLCLGVLSLCTTWCECVCACGYAASIPTDRFGCIHTRSVQTSARRRRQSPPVRVRTFCGIPCPDVGLRSHRSTSAGFASACLSVGGEGESVGESACVCCTGECNIVWQFFCIIPSRASHFMSKTCCTARTQQPERARERESVGESETTS